MIFVGDDWAEAHHDVYLCDEAGARLGKARLPEGIEGIARFHALVAEHVDDPGEVIVGACQVVCVRAGSGFIGAG